MMRSKEGVVSYEVTVDEKKNKVLVSVELQARKGRERTVRIESNDVRRLLESQGVETGVAISGFAIHNNMSRALGLRTAEDLKSNWVFELASAEVEESVAEPVVEDVPEVSVEASVEPVIEQVVVNEKPKVSRSRKPRAKKSVDK